MKYKDLYSKELFKELPQPPSKAFLELVDLIDELDTRERPLKFSTEFIQQTISKCIPTMQNDQERYMINKIMDEVMSKLLLEKELVEKIEQKDFIVPKDLFIQEHGNLIDMPIARYDKGTPAKYYKQNAKGSGFIVYTVGNNTIEIGSTYGALTGFGEMILMDGIPKFNTERENYTVSKFYEPEMLDTLGIARKGRYYALLRQELKKIFNLSVVYNRFKFVTKHGTKKRTEIQSIGISLFPTRIWDKEKKLWVGIWHPLFHRNLYKKLLSDRVLKAIDNKRSKRAYRYLDKAMGIKNWHKENIDSLAIKLSIVTKHSTLRLKQLRQSLRDVKHGYGVADWEFKYKIQDNLLCCSKSRAISHTDRQEQEPAKEENQREKIITLFARRIIANMNCEAEPIVLDEYIRQVRGATKGITTETLETILEEFKQHKWTPLDLNLRFSKAKRT